MNTWYQICGKTYQCQISNAGGWFIGVRFSKTFPWLLMIFQSSMTFHDFSRKFHLSRFSRPCGNPDWSVPYYFDMECDPVSDFTLIRSILFWYGMWSCIWFQWPICINSTTSITSQKIFNEAGNCFLKQSKYTTVNASVNDRFVAPYVAHVAVLTHWGRDKWTPFHRRHF